MATKSVTVKVQCEACFGTGLYRGVLEGDGAAVVCWRCKGTGGYALQYTPYEGRHYRAEVRRVFPQTGRKVRADDFTSPEGVFYPFSQWGVSYQEWLAGAVPPPDRELTCPLQADQGDPAAEGTCRHSEVGQEFSACPFQPAKADCWALYDAARGA